MGQNGYKARPSTGAERIVFLMAREDVNALDAWGVPAGMSSRSEAIRELIRRGLREQGEANENPREAATSTRAQDHHG